MDYILLRIIDTIICDTYNREFKYNRTDRPGPNTAMEIDFRLNIDYDKEDGYRHLILRIFGTGYVTVVSKETWNVAPVSKMDLDNPPYDEGETEWKFLGCHDSCWRDAVHRLLSEYEDKLTGIDSITGWYKKIELTIEEMELYRKLESEAYGR